MVYSGGVCGVGCCPELRSCFLIAFKSFDKGGGLRVGLRVEGTSDELRVTSEGGVVPERCSGLPDFRGSSASLPNPRRDSFLSSGLNLRLRMVRSVVPCSMAGESGRK